MKKKLFALLLVAISALSCQNGIWDAIRDLENKYADLDGRVAKLEELCKEMNTNISSLQTLVSVILTNDYIISVTPITKDGKEIGYTITFAIHEPITIYHGQNGADGKDGENGKDGKDGKNGENGTNGQDGKDGLNGQDGKDGLNGQDGKDGADGITPIIGVAQDETDHAYYWTLNGAWLLDANGNRIPLSSRDGINGQDGQDGRDGRDGTNGQDGITPRLKIEDGYWFISYDNGVTWTQLGKAVGENGQDGQDGQNGEKGDKGDKGEPGYSMFTDVTQDDEFVYFTLYNGTVLTVRKGNSTFDQTIIDNLVTSLTLDQTEVWMSAIGETVQINATTTPFPNSKVNWSSSDSTIVSIVDGLLTAIRTGQVTITAKAGDKTNNLEVYVAIGDGLLSGEFSISETQKVRFSKGRLQYNPMQGSHHCADGTIKPGTWRFAENQYDTINAKCPNAFTDAWYDLFSYGTSGYSSYVPWSNSFVSEDLSEKSDWGRYNAIDNGDNMPNQWRCLKRDEWIYINSSRANASNLRISGNINGVGGIIILPDNCTLPTDAKFGGVLTMSEWNLLEQYGAVFIPYFKKNIEYGGKYYNVMDWTASWAGTNYSGYYLAWSYSYEFGIHSRHDLHISTTSVRLVKDIE